MFFVIFGIALVALVLAYLMFGTSPTVRFHRLLIKGNRAQQAYKFERAERIFRAALVYAEKQSLWAGDHACVQADLGSLALQRGRMAEAGQWYEQAQQFYAANGSRDAFGIHLHGVCGL